MLTTDQIFKELKGRGATRAVVDFYGGGDEGYVEDIKLYDVEGTEIDSITEDEVEIYDSIYQMLSDEWNGFNGDTDVNGKMVWDIHAKKITESGSHTTWVGYERELG